jgi:hypothetical protein
MLGFVILHGHLEHIIAPDTDTMNLQRLLATVLPRGLILWRCVRLAHCKILTCQASRARILERNSGVFLSSERNSGSIRVCLGGPLTGLLQFCD